jgi:hypothetical protein
LGTKAGTGEQKEMQEDNTSDIISTISVAET